ncbi:MAG TPA: serine/threonine-protein kinase [Thermoanaerobaculia bacterium]|nr:serine/threonine-protein kinase [Thermoanaerobaculia bacterium]
MKLGRYEVVRELGKGAMGIVYLAKDPLIGRLVALKTIRPAAHSDDDETREFQQRFIREAQAAGILNHPTIVTVHDIGQDEASGVSFIAMEYVEGQNLKEVLQQGRAMSFEQIGDIAAQVADALDFAHSKGIVHRDVKPANIILLEGMRAKITDFGIAKIASGGANLTSTGQFLGTPNYMAPEQIKGAPVDGRTDLFSLGICLYELLTRRKPFGGDSLTSISYKIVHEPFPPLHEINPQIPDGYEEVVTKCLAKDPARRYQRGRDLANALRAVIRGERPLQEPAEETIVTRLDRGDRGERTPTIEVPFPEADSEPTPMPSATRAQQPGPAATTAPERPAARPAAGAARPKSLRNTLTNVRAHPTWGRRIAAPIFLAITALLVVALLATVLLLQRKQVPVAKVDTVAETKRAKERQLRTAGNAAVRQGRVEDAYNRFSELLKIAPSSPAIANLVNRLGSIRQQQEISNQQLQQAQQKLNDGLALYNKKDYSGAIPLLEEAFHLNPNSDDAANYLKLAQQEQAKLDTAKAERRSQQKIASRTVTPVTTTRTPNGGDGGGQLPVNNTPASLTTIFNSALNDGYIQVKVGSTIVAHENLWEEKGRFFRRKTPRVVNVTKDVPPANTDVEIWVVVPSMQIQERHTIHQNFAPGTSHKLLVSFDPASKKFGYEIN